MVGLQIAPSLFTYVLCSFHGMAQCPVATSNDSHNPRLRNAKGGRQFAGIQYAQTATGTGTDIEQPAATPHPWHYGFYQHTDLWNDLPDGSSHDSVFLVDVLQYLHDRHLLQMVEVGWLLSDFDGLTLFHIIYNDYAKIANGFVILKFITQK